MNYVTSFSIGLVVAFTTTLLPGLINMTTAKLSLNEGKSKALSLSLGASFVVFFQAFIATLFGKFLDQRADISHLIQRIAIGVFLLVSVYFFFFAGKKKVEQQRVILKGKKGYFLSGMLLSLINLFPIPFYVVLSVTLSTYNWFSFEKMFIGMFALGASSGAMLAFYGYIVFIQKIESRTDFFMKNVNYLIGSITFIIAIIGVFKLI
jgi:threonine/homoserine/homoserine lactone efflux protein